MSARNCSSSSSRSRRAGRPRDDRAAARRTEHAGRRHSAAARPAYASSVGRWRRPAGAAGAHPCRHAPARADTRRMGPSSMQLPRRSSHTSASTASMQAASARSVLVRPPSRRRRPEDRRHVPLVVAGDGVMPQTREHQQTVNPNFLGSSGLRVDSRKTPAVRARRARRTIAGPAGSGQYCAASSPRARAMECTGCVWLNSGSSLRRKPMICPLSREVSLARNAASGATCSGRATPADGLTAARRQPVRHRGSLRSSGSLWWERCCWSAVVLRHVERANDLDRPTRVILAAA